MNKKNIKINKISNKCNKKIMKHKKNMIIILN